VDVGPSGGHGAAATARGGSQADLVQPLGLCLWAGRICHWQTGERLLASLMSPIYLISGVIASCVYLQRNKVLSVGLIQACT